MDSLAVVFERPQVLSVSRLMLTAPTDADVVVETDFTGISTGTERLLWTGTMPDFPGMGYPLVPGYETVGHVVDAGKSSGRTVGDSVFVGGARCYQDARALFGGAAKHLVVPGERAIPVDSALHERATLLALAATAYHAISSGANGVPELIIGHGVLGRLLARLAVLLGDGRDVTVWETNPLRVHGATTYRVCTPDDDPRRDYRSIYDVSGDSRILDSLIARLAPAGEIVLAGFYSDALSFHFPAAFQREARVRVAAQWLPADLTAVAQLMNSGTLALDDLITHRSPATSAASAYDTAFHDAACVKMVLDWRQCS